MGVSLPVLVDSVQNAFEHRSITALSCALVGFSIGLGVWICARDSKKYYVILGAALFFISILASGVWLQYLARRLTALPVDLEATTGLPITALTISDVKLYEVGLFASGILWLVVMVVFILNRLGFGIKSRSL